MDENDVIVIDTRNASILPAMLQKTGTTRPPVIVTRAQPQPVYMQQPATSGTVYGRDPATGALVREPAGGFAAAPASKLSTLGTGKLIGLGVQVLALLMPLPSAPSATGDVTKDVRNSTVFAEAVALSEQRRDRLNTIGSLIAQVMA